MDLWKRRTGKFAFKIFLRYQFVHLDGSFHILMITQMMQNKDAIHNVVQ